MERSIGRRTTFLIVIWVKGSKSLESAEPPMTIGHSTTIGQHWTTHNIVQWSMLSNGHHIDHWTIGHSTTIGQH